MNEKKNTFKKKIHSQLSHQCVLIIELTLTETQTVKSDVTFALFAIEGRDVAGVAVTRVCSFHVYTTSISARVIQTLIDV